MGVQDTASEETEEDRRKTENLLNGPQIYGPATSQDDIDALFDGDAPAGMGQDDIDALFD